MGKVTVHYYRVWDHQRGRSVVHPLKSTAERIEMLGGKIIPGTAEEIEAVLLDPQGRYRPRAEHLQS